MIPGNAILSLLRDRGFRGGDVLGPLFFCGLRFLLAVTVCTAFLEKGNRIIQQECCEICGLRPVDCNFELGLALFDMG
jgi:hypothetical protein